MPSRPLGTIDKSPRQARPRAPSWGYVPILFFVPRGRFIRKRSLLVNFFAGLIAVIIMPIGNASKHFGVTRVNVE
jgi:hypothetical protein